MYWISKGVTAWKNYDLNSPQPDAADDKGDVLVVKSGTDFQDLSEIVLTLQDTPPGSIRKKIIKEMKGEFNLISSTQPRTDTDITLGQRHVTRGDTPVNQELKAIVDEELGTIKAAMKDPICVTDVTLDVRSSFVRLNEVCYRYNSILTAI